MRLALRRRERDLYGPKRIRRRREFARKIERGDLIICPRCGGRSAPISFGIWAMTTAIPHGHGRRHRQLQPRCRECAEDLARVVTRRASEPPSPSRARGGS